jgi:RNA polymerase sigma-70 factor (ECF subfamily)
VVSLGDTDGLAVGREAPTSSGEAATEVSFESFFEIEFPRVTAFAFVLTGDRGVAEELAQEAMLRAFRRWDRIGAYDRPGAWVRRVVANLASSARRRRSVEAVALVRSWGAIKDVELAGHAGEHDDDLWRLVRGLPRRQRDAIALFYLEDWSVRDIARFMGCSEATARVHLHRARVSLARALGLEEA